MKEILLFKIIMRFIGHSPFLMTISEVRDEGEVTVVLQHYIQKDFHILLTLFNDRVRVTLSTRKELKNLIFYEGEEEITIVEESIKHFPIAKM